MKNILHTLRRLHNDESGQDLIEYALIAALIALGSVLVMKGLSDSINVAFNKIGTDLTTAIP